MDSSFSPTNVAAAAICLYALFGTIFFNRKSRSNQENTKMASSSLTLVSPPSSLPRNWIHHVFPSFHGADVRTNFLSHALKELRSKGINSFIDNNIERSKSISPELIIAINGSRIAIVLLSKNYASSTWCLNELVEIINCREEFDQTVIPIFYEVDPTDVKKQIGEFGKVFKKTCKGKTDEEIKRWKDALTEVGQIAGYHSTNGKTEVKMIEDLATDVSDKLNLSAPCSDFDGLVGMESHMKEMGPLLQLDSDEVRRIGIWGPPGIGKTTIARFLFNRHSHEFQLSVFIDNIKRKYVITASSDDYSVKLDLQKQFMSRITNEKDINIPHLGVAKDRLKDMKVLVVLDDVDHLVQLEAMAKETCWFGPGSRIIITTQDQRILKASGINHIHKVDLPSNDEALQMFCMYAFDHNYTNDGLKEEIACEVMSLVGELPLGLKIMGSYFQGMSKQDWIEALPRLKAHLNRNGEIESILKFSYDALNDEDKSLFLYIACFFNYENVDIVESCLANFFLDVTQGLRVLAEKSLISIKYGSIHMAELLVQLGRKIVRELSVGEPGKRQFLNDAVDIGDVLSDDKAGSSRVIGINLELDEEITWTSERAFKRLSNLQFLRIFGQGGNPQSMKYISRKLRVLTWPVIQMTCFPSSFNPEFLVRLEMPYSSLEKLWKENKPLNNLMWMDLSWSKRLKELPNLSTATNLQELDVSHCSSLVELPSSIGNAINLRELILTNCSSLVKLPSSIGNATNLQELNLIHCSSLVELPSSMRNLGRLSRLKLEGCSKLEVNLANINLESLEELNLSGCSLLKSYHESSTELDPWIGRKSRLLILKLNEMKNQVSLPQIPDSVEEIDAKGCESLERLDCSFRNPNIRLNFANCFKLNQEARDLIIHTPTNGYAVFPAEEMPMCFTHRSSGSSVTVKLNQMPLGKSTKFKACFILAGGKDIYRVSVSCLITFGGNYETYLCPKKIEAFPTRHLLTFEGEVETGDMVYTELRFDFHIGRSNTIKECGILPLTSGGTFIEFPR